MSYYESDEALQDIHDELYRQEEERPKGGWASLQQTTKFWVGIAIAVVVFLMYSERVTFGQGLMLIGAIVLIVYLSLGEGTRRKELTNIECMMRLNDQLLFLQKHPIGQVSQVPRGKVKVDVVGKKQWMEGRGIKRSYAVDVFDELHDVTHQYLAEVDIFTGDIITFRHAPEGVSGRELKDLKLMPTPDMLYAKKRDEYIGQKLYGK